MHEYNVKASTTIPCDSYFGPIYYQHFQELASRRMHETGMDIGVIEMTAVNKILLSRTQTQKSWYLYLDIARDIFEQNLQLYKSRDGHMYIRCTKTIHEGDVMKYWFDDKLAGDMNIPHLTPANISGICRYTCHVCSKEFIHPNPLKLHLMDQHRGDTNEPIITQFPWLPNIQVSPSRIGPCGQYQMSNILSEANRRLSDHVKAVKLEENQTNSQSDMRQGNVTTHGLKSLPRYTLKASIELISNSGYKQDHSVPFLLKHEDCEPKNYETIKLEDQPMDELKSNYCMRSSKKGHLCVFCGKLYSRKYGLKIHLRTHTGYKPLRCKYCFRAFGDPSNLNKHIRLHAQGTTPYQCTYCNKVLVRRRDLVRHLKSRHSNEATKT